MHSARLRKIGESIVIAVPPAILEVLDMRVGTDVGLAVEGGRLVIAPSRQPRYTLDELLSQCDPALDVTDEERAWLESPPEGRELL